MHIREMFPKNQLATEDLKGRSVTLTIASVELQDVRDRDTGKTKKKWVLFFKELHGRNESNGRGKTLVLGVTNAKSIAALHRKANPSAPEGAENEANNWPGLRITIFPTTCSAFGNPQMPCMRIDPNLPPQKGKSPPVPDLDADPPDPEPPPDMDEEAAE